MTPIAFAWPSRPTRLFALAFATAFASCMALAAWAADDASAPPHRMPPPMAMPGGPMMLPRGPMLDHLLDDVKASPLQHAQVHQILDAADAELRAGRAASRADREQIGQLFSQPVVDAAAVEAVRLRLEQRHDADSRRLTQALVDVSLVLDADQRQLIAKRLASGPRPGDGARPLIPAAQP